MTGLSLSTNIASLNAQRNLTQSSKALETSFARLSSGMRINRASDDAAGLSVSSLLDTDRRVLAQGIRNLNDGISYLNIAESAVTELTNIMFRVQEIAEQSANGTFSDTQRKPLQDEVTALQSEYNRIINSTRFNNMQLLTGENTRVNLQAGYGEAGGLTAQVGSALLSDAFGLQSAGETVRVSTSSSGGEGNSNSGINSISADGRFVVFTTASSNLIPGVSGQQTYLKDVQTGELRLASSTASGVQGNGTSGLASLSADGRFVAFYSISTNLIPGVSGQQIYLKDIQTGELRLASSTASGVQGDGSSKNASLSADGRFLAFTSSSSNLIPGVSGQQIYLKDIQTGELRLASSTASGAQGNNSSFAPTLSADGRFLAFYSASINLISGVTGNQIYLKDLQTGELSLASSTASGEQGDNSSLAPALSADGRFLAFTSSSSNLIPGVSGEQLYRKDILTGEIELVSRSSSGTIGQGFAARLSADGSKVFFTSSSSILVDGDTNGVHDVFLRDLSKTGIDELAGMVVSNQASARITLALSKQRLETLNLARAGIGASVSRIETGISNLSSMTQNIALASSQITDTDVAQESAKLVAAQILQQAGAAVLAQTNAQPEITLQLIRSV